MLFERMMCDYQSFNHYIIQYGVPLDDRHDYTKTDWLMWTAAMGSDEQVKDNYTLCAFEIMNCRQIYCFTGK